MNLNFTDFKEAELANWIVDYLNIFIRPRVVISNFLKLNSSERVRKLIFHFIIFVCSLFLFEGTYEKLSWLKIVTGSIISLIPLSLLALISIKIVRSKAKFEEVIFYILLSFLLVQPLFNLLISKYLLSENFIYYVLEEILLYITITWLFLNFSTIFSENRIQALYLFLIGYIIWNILFVVSLRFSDRYSSLNNHLFSDPIYEEYQAIEGNLLQKDKSITGRSCVLQSKANKSFCYSFGQNIIRDSLAHTNNEEYEKYKQDVQLNISFLKSIQEKVQSRENQTVTHLWLQYFLIIENELKTDSLIKTKDDIIKQRMNLVTKDSSYSEVQFYMSGVNSIVDQVNIRTHLVAYNNRIRKHYDFNESFDIGIRATIYLLGSTINYLLGKYIFEDEKPKIDKNDFYELP